MTKARKKKEPIFYMTKVGMLPVPYNSTPNQCRRKDHHYFRYALKIGCKPKLNSQGFVIDHHNISKALLRLERKALSCEQYCLQVAIVVEQLLKSQRVPVIDMTVRVQPVAGVQTENGMEYRELSPNDSAFMELTKTY